VREIGDLHGRRGTDCPWAMTRDEGASDLSKQERESFSIGRGHRVRKINAATPRLVRPGMEEARYSQFRVGACNWRSMLQWFRLLAGVQPELMIGGLPEIGVNLEQKLGSAGCRLAR